jgi:flagellar basal-body rod protein FlgF
MDSGYYAALTGLVARMQTLDTVADNLANTQTPGYRAEREYFRSTLLGQDAVDSQLGHTVDNYGLLGGDTLNLTQGAISQTGNPLDLAIEGQGFFEIQTANGLRFTRDGAFHRTAKGALVTGRGEPVMDTKGKPITLPPGKISIGANGVISVDGGVVATVGVYTFPSGVQLTPEGTDRYVAPQTAKPVLSQDASIHQGALEAANEDVVQGTVDLIMTQRQAEMMQKALTTFYVDFNKFATEDLPKV